MYETISKIVNDQFSKGAFKSNFFGKDDLISDMYLYLSEIDKELTEKEIIEILKKRFFTYFEIYDIKDEKSYDRFETGSDAIKTKVTPVISKEKNKVYEFFENIIWKDGKQCPKCKSKEVYPSEKSERQHDCRNCGHTFSFSQNTNLHRASAEGLKNIITLNNLILNGVICFREMQDKTGLSKKVIRKSFSQNLPHIINNEDLIVPAPKKVRKEIKPNLGTFKEHTHQTETIAKATEYFRDNDRGKIIHPCGSGKTYNSIKIAQNLKCKKIVVIVPSKLLLKQQVRSFLSHFPEHEFYIFGSIKKFDDKRVKILGETVEKQRAQISKIKKDSKCVIFTTLTSFSKMEKDFENEFFDFAIFDEAHRVAGEDYKIFINTLNFKCYKKALFLTATEKNYNDDKAVGMNNELFGNTISKIYMKEMIDADVICDYNIVNIGFESNEVKELLERHEEFFLDVKVKLPVRTRVLTSALALVKCMEKYNLKKVITYHSTIEESVLFINVFKLFQSKIGLNIGCYNIHSSMSNFNFQNNLDGFINDEKSVISSVNCFQEGIDVIEVDAVLYGYPKKSKIDIPQSVGRCIRKDPNKEKGYIIIPDVIGDSNTFGKLIDVLNGLENCDDRISDFKYKKVNDFKSNILFNYYESQASNDFNFDYFYKNIDIYFRGREFLSLELFQEWCAQNRIKNKPAFLKAPLPYFIPKQPAHYYKQSWRKIFNREFASIEEVCQWITEKQIKNHKIYRERREDSMPDNPMNFFKMPYTFFFKKQQYASFEECRKFAKSNEIYSLSEWISYPKPENMPKYPNHIYKISLNELFGKPSPWDYEKCKTWFKENKELGIDSLTKLRKDSRVPEQIPRTTKSAINRFGEDWKGWGDILGAVIKNISDKESKLSFEDAKKYVLSCGISTKKDWEEWRKSPQFPKFLPKFPKIYYKNFTFRKLFSKEFINFERTKEIMQIHKIKNFKELTEFRKNFTEDGKIIASNPNETYKSEWRGNADFFFKEAKYVTWEEFKNWAKEAKIKKYMDFERERKNHKSIGIPSQPRKIYKEYWKGWKEFFNSI